MEVPVALMPAAGTHSLPRALQTKSGGVPRAALGAEVPVTVRLAWSNEPVGLPVTWKTGVEGSTNLRDWEILAMVPYSTNGGITLSNQPAYRFYRVYNTY